MAEESRANTQRQWEKDLIKVIENKGILGPIVICSPLRMGKTQQEMLRLRASKAHDTITNKL